MSHPFTAMVTLAALAAAPVALGQWVTFEDVTNERLPAGLNDPSLTLNDNEEKDYAWGDVDQDGDIDLVVVRKQPFTSTGKEANLLLMNEGTAEGHAIDGVLVDRTVEYATASDVAGDNGFLTATNDRDVVLVDVDGDGWLDMVTAPTLTDNQAKNLSHPRVYMNLGESGGEWLGFRYEDARIPQMHPTAGPRFCSVAAGDLTGDGAPDLYFGDYDSGGSQIFDYNNKLLINDGNGFFIDESNTRLTGEMRLSAFGAASVIADMNNDGSLDIVKQTSLNAPQHVAITYNRADQLGSFFAYDIINQDAPYFVSVGDLNNDGRLDVVVVDDGTDSYLLNQGNQGGLAGFNQQSLPSGPSGGFGGNSFIADLDNDGFQDIIVTDVDVDIPGCQRVTAIYRNDGNAPTVGFSVQANGIPQSQLTGVHDVAVFDIDGDGWLDLVLGQCDGMRIYRNVPPIGIDVTYPDGRPVLLSPNQPTSISIAAEGFGGTIDPDSLELRYSIAGSPYASVAFADAGGTFTADLPGVPCLVGIEWYVAAAVSGTEFTDPPQGAADAFATTAATGTEVTLADSIEGDTSGWRITSSALSAGAWEPATPNGTINSGDVAAPFEDATEGAGTRAFVTQNGLPGGSATVADVDGGPTTLESPVFDGSNDPIISFKRWFYVNNGDDSFDVAISFNGGTSYTTIPSLSTSGTGGEWETVSFRPSDFTVPSSSMRVRFRTADNPNNSVTEAGVDDFMIQALTCSAPCPTDVDGSGATDFNDIVGVLAVFGTSCAGCPEDVNGSGSVDFTDVIDILANFGPCG